MYDQIAELYHLIFEDWETSIEWQAKRLDKKIAKTWGGRVSSVLDVSCGIGTQAIGLAQSGYEVQGCDLSSDSVRRARVEAANRGLNIPFSVCDMRTLESFHGQSFDLVMTCDNALPHLLNDADILRALKQMLHCLRPGGGLLLTIRDYAATEVDKSEFHSYGIRCHAGQRYVVFQTRQYDGDYYDVALYFVRESDPPIVHVGRSRYYAIKHDRVSELMQEAGFVDVARCDEAYYHPVLTASRP